MVKSQMLEFQISRFVALYKIDMSPNAVMTELNLVQQQKVAPNRVDIIIQIKFVVLIELL